MITHLLFDEEFNKGKPAVIDEVVAVDYVDHSATPAPAPGPEGFKKRAEMLCAVFAPEMTFGEFLAEGDQVAFSWTMRGVHQGTFAGTPPTGKPISGRAIGDRAACDRALELAGDA